LIVLLQTNSNARLIARSALKRHVGLVWPLFMVEIAKLSVCLPMSACSIRVNPRLRVCHEVNRGQIHRILGGLYPRSVIHRPISDHIVVVFLMNA